MHATEYNKKLYWDSRAAAYPRPFEPSMLAKTRRRIKYLMEQGIDFAGKDFLDIGCGTGIYSLVLAKQCRSVMGVDSSEAMLSHFKEDAEEHGILNSGFIVSEWGAVPEELLRKKYDIVLASMTAAVQSYDEVLKMETAAREWCVYIGWAGERHNAMLEKIYAHHGAKYLPPPGCENVLAALDKAGHKYSAEYVYDAWFKVKTVSDTIEDLKINMQVNDAELDLPWTKKLLEKRASRTKDGMVWQKTRVKKAIIIW
ncbi:MAG: methyltransferase domain-containing protein, partial [Elusimicrobiales bacterium]|nr:methyltransferase domain-containing protein [Elusimicrobiales bacterium]